MSETAKPATLPDRYKPKMSELPPTVKDLYQHGRGYTTAQAIRVDRNGGVWIDRTATLVPAIGQGPPPKDFPVTLNWNGLCVVGLREAYRQGCSWSRSPMESFDVEGLRQFEPVSQVD